MTEFHEARARAAELGWTGTVAPAVDFEYFWEARGDSGRVVPAASTAGQGGESS
jgi:hypothetical protein